MEILSKEKITAAKDWKTTEVAVPQWGGAVRVRSLDGRAYGEYIDRARELDQSGAKSAALQAFVAASGICDNVGNTMFTEDELLSKDAEAVGLIAEEVLVLSGLYDTAAEELEGNSDGDRNESSSSD